MKIKCKICGKDITNKLELVWLQTIGHDGLWGTVEIHILCFIKKIKPLLKEDK